MLPPPSPSLGRGHSIIMMVVRGARRLIGHPESRTSAASAPTNAAATATATAGTRATAATTATAGTSATAAGTATAKTSAT